MRKLSSVRVDGPLEAYVPGYRRELTRLGYSRPAAVAHLQLMAHVSRWLGERGLAPAEFNVERAAEFLADRRASGQVRRLTPRGLIPLLGFLRELGVVPAPSPVAPADSRGQLVEAFAGHLAAERGLSEKTIVGYRRVASSFLSAVGWDGAPESLATLSAKDLNAYLLAECARRSVGSADNVTTALRGLMRFLYVNGLTQAPLADAVGRAPTWCDGGWSRALAAGDVAKLLASCDRRTAAGRRDFAIVTVLARLGLRSGEVASLRLDDVDWRAGELVVVGKGNRRDPLPLPVDVGRAIADYCRRGRPRNAHRNLFLHVRAPYAALSSSAVSHVVLRACLRAGIPPARAHRLRHSTASAMRRAGVPLFEIGQVLRHSHTVTTAIYAKDDLDALASITRRWPGAAK